MVSIGRTPIVVVIASFDGIVSNAPWLVNTSTLTFVVYQRTDPSTPNFVPNIGFVPMQGVEPTE